MFTGIVSDVGQAIETPPERSEFSGLWLRQRDEVQRLTKRMTGNQSVTAGRCS
jgi:hypothetical protein